MSRPRLAPVYLLILVALALVQPGVTRAQQDADSNLVKEEPVDLDVSRIDQSSPLSTARLFMRAADLGKYATASEYLDLRYLPDEVAAVDPQVLAEQLHIVISREIRIDFGALSDDPGGMTGDGLPNYRDELGAIDTPNDRVPIYLQLIPGPDNSDLWKISNATVAEIPQLYAEFGYSPFVEKVRQYLPRGSFLGAELFKWAIALIVGIASAFAWLVVAWPLSWILTRHNDATAKRVKRYLRGPIPATICIVLAWAVLRNLGLGETAARFANGATVVTIVTVWLLFASINLIRDLYTAHLESHGRVHSTMIISPATTTMKVIILLLALVMWLDNIGINVTALIAGLGVGGLAVALVLQRPMEDMLGAMTLYVQQPVTVGQFCTCGDVTGTIEEIRLRSTRIRKLDDSLVAIPNSVLATASIQNISARHRILHRQILRLALDTSDSKIKALLEVLRAALESNKNVTQDDWRVRFVEFGEYSKNVEVFAYIETTNWRDFLAISEDINLQTAAALRSVGVALAVRVLPG